MKSIREWIMENEFNTTSLRNVMGGTSTKINSRMKMMLRPKLEQVMKEFEGENPMELLRDIIAISVSVIGDTHGSRITTDKILDIVKDLPEDSSEEEQN